MFVFWFAAFSGSVDDAFAKRLVPDELWVIVALLRTEERLGGVRVAGMVYDVATGRVETLVKP